MSRDVRPNARLSCRYCAPDRDSYGLQLSSWPNNPHATQGMMQKCSLSNRRRSFEDDVPISDRTFEINSHISVPCHLEQCLNLKTGEVYYINRKTGINNNNNAYDDFSGESDVAVV
ncbi:hypothetical protein HID58_066081 [Brassica napus]|uniref:Uncharacterized protein n=1 Tax=Brassica napus TaxID=3708 RepID=A0ABQ7ZEN4_BRANA|nr:hypothetical protein HID58_066081 [Brassica napus]